MRDLGLILLIYFNKRNVTILEDVLEAKLTMIVRLKKFTLIPSIGLLLQWHQLDMETLLQKIVMKCGLQQCLNSFLVLYLHTLSMLFGKLLINRRKANKNFSMTS